MPLDFWLLTALFLWVVIVAVRARGTLAAALAPSRGPARLWLLLLFAVGLGLRLLVVPHTHYTYDDSFFHLDIATNLRNTLRFFVRLDDFMEGARAEHFPKWMPVHHYLVSFVFRLAPPTGATVQAYNAVVGALTVPAAFFLGRALFEKDLSGLLLAALLCLYPVHLKFSGSSGIEPTSTLLTTLALTFLAVHWRRGDSSTARLALTLSVLCALTRIDNAATTALVCGFVVLKALREQDGAARRARILAVLGALAFVAALTLISFSAYSSWRARAAPANPLSALRFLFTNPLNTPLLPVLAILGAIALWRRDRILAAALVGTWLVYLFAYTCLHRIDVDYVDFHRFHLNTCPFQLALAAAALDFLARRPGHLGVAGLAVVGALYGAFVVLSAGSISHQYWPECSAEVEWLERTAPSLGADAVVVTPAPIFVRAVAGLRTALLTEELVSRSFRTQRLFYYCPPYRAPDLAVGGADRSAAELAGRFSLVPFAVKRTASGDECGLFRMLEREAP